MSVILSFMYMPVIHPGNNRIGPANNRSVAVAKSTLQNIIPVQQRRFANAFAVTGYSTLVYNLLEAGKPCSCGAKGKVLANRLNKEGKLDNGEINKLVTGGYEFKILPYGVKRNPTKLWREDQGLPEPHRPELEYNVDEDGESQPPPFINVSRDPNNPAAKHIQDGGFGASGPVQTQEKIDELEESPFDPETFEINNVSCPVCLGTSFVGGANLLGGWREILTPEDMESDGMIDTLSKPLKVEHATSSRWKLILPKGAWQLDALKVWNKNKMVPATILVDATPVANEYDFLRYCDGTEHTIDVIFSTASDFTHVEIQAAISETPFHIEFPQLNENSDLSKLDRTDDVQIYASPELPFIRTRDLLVEGTFNKVFQVVNSTHWNDQQQRVLGWNMNARVVQPQELWSLLPRRTITKQKTTIMVRSNMSQSGKVT